MLLYHFDPWTIKTFILLLDLRKQQFSWLNFQNFYFSTLLTLYIYTLFYYLIFITRYNKLIKVDMIKMRFKNLRHECEILKFVKILIRVWIYIVIRIIMTQQKCVSVLLFLRTCMKDMLVKLLLYLGQIIYIFYIA